MRQTSNNFLRSTQGSAGLKFRGLWPSIADDISRDFVLFMVPRQEIAELVSRGILQEKGGLDNVKLTYILPMWDAHLRGLSVCGMIIKKFKRMSSTQELILTAFQEDGWCSRIDDPIPPIPGKSAKQRLRDAIKNLNSGQSPNLIRFRGDGTGAGITWEYNDCLDVLTAPRNVSPNWKR